MNKGQHPQPQDAYLNPRAQELAGHLNLLEEIDFQVSPEHVAERFRELLGRIGEGDPCARPGGSLRAHPAAPGTFPGSCTGAQRGRQPYPTVCLLRGAAREAGETKAAARHYAEYMHDAALGRAARMEAEARQKAERLLDEARREAASIKALALAEAIVASLIQYLAVMTGPKGAAMEAGAGQDPDSLAG